MSRTPDALLFLATECQHCPLVLQALGELVKAGTIGRLEVVNIQHSPEFAQRLNVRSVPWVKIGPFELIGLRSLHELKRWVERVEDPAAMGDYFSELMVTGQLQKVEQLVKSTPEHFEILIRLMADMNTELSVRVGVSALIEEFMGSELLEQNVDALGAHTQHKEARIRNDACFYLGMTDSEGAIKYVKPLLDDENRDVREAASEALDRLMNNSGLR